ncbi:MAG: phosphoglycerate dehydrogenase [Desulfobacterales bacterium]|nr:phosphoglycerate dehydrogenase [Desulfobacterales bacterium]
MTWKVLVSAPYFLPVIDSWRDRLAQEGVELIAAQVNERLSEEELLDVVADIDGIICGDDRITERVLEAAPRLKVISKWGTGIDSIDSKAAAARGVPVCRTRNAFSEPVADSALGYMLTFARKMTSLDREIRQGKWKKPQLMALGECVLGVVGVGDCGKAVVRRAVSFGMRVLGNDIVELPNDFVDATGLEVVSLKELLATADFVSLHTDLNETSFHLIGKAQLEQMKSGAYLINTSRGPVVNEPDLIDALQKRIIAGAALDVFEDEPLPGDSPLRQLDNCLLAPHTANSSPKAWNRVHESTVRNLLEVLQKTGK